MSYKLKQLQDELTQARDFYYPKHWGDEERERHNSRIKRLEAEVERLKAEKEAGGRIQLDDAFDF